MNITDVIIIFVGRREATTGILILSNIYPMQLNQAELLYIKRIINIFCEFYIIEIAFSQIDF